MPTDELTPKDAAHALGVSLSSLNRYVERGLLHPRRLPSGYRRFNRAEVAGLRAQGERAVHPPGAA